MPPGPPGARSVGDSGTAGVVRRCRDDVEAAARALAHRPERSIARATASTTSRQRLTTRAGPLSPMLQPPGAGGIRATACRTVSDATAPAFTSARADPASSSRVSGLVRGL